MGVRAVSTQTRDGIVLCEGLGTFVAVGIDRSNHQAQVDHIGAGADTVDYTVAGVQVDRTEVEEGKVDCTAAPVVVAHIVVGVGTVVAHTLAAAALVPHLGHSWVVSWSVV